MDGHAKQPNDNLNELQTELEEYIKPWQGKVTLHYQNLLKDVSVEINSDKMVPEASTIKLPYYIKGDKAQTGILHLDIKNNQIIVFCPFKIVQDQIIVQTEQERQGIWTSLKVCLMEMFKLTME
jgi:hypothetical protein